MQRLLAIDEANSARAPDGLTAATLLYLALPHLIFLAGWLRPAAAIPMLALTLLAVAQFLRRDDMRWSMPQSAGTSVMIIVLGFAWASLGGAGHFFHANPDWVMRDKVLGDLTFSDWPPAYNVIDGQPHILRSAIGFFLPAAIVGKLAGIGSVDLALYLYTALGCSLFLLLLPLPTRPSRLLLGLLLVAVFFSGMDYLGAVMSSGSAPIFPLRLEWWVPFCYPSFTGQMYWAPNHAIPIWLVATLFYRHWGHRAWPALFLILLPLTVIWTPFVVIGILPFLALATLRWFAQGLCFADSRITLWQIVAAVLTTWLTVRLMTLDIAAIPSAPTTAVAPKPDNLILDYLLFILMEFAILALLLARNLRHSYGLFWLACAILTLLPLYNYGPSNDMLLRLSTPCLVFLLLLTLDQIQHWVSRRSFPRSAWAIGIVLLIGANTPFNEMWRALFFKRVAPNYGRSLVEENRNVEPPHYVGRLDRPDLLAVLRTPTLVPKAAERNPQALGGAAPSPKPE
ncbi:hypothetical protein [Sulfuritalea hydrogenivorans]|jgi:hypothetical protein|uniref:Uncharacterized protein n=1 Tax=Sulfuritalea hydrogenivorans sk43H TaxID=1223802 RepID=W0SIW1_9PROT|nr:hypothetical protein [Sulfuritalea hydrogenivorans]BAO30566.1 hypothetical protein SUTH_02787 [Sulfuritalea hydrogenivorans sk43H]